MFTLAQCKNLHSLSLQCSYNETSKEKFRRLAMKFLKELALQTSMGSADLRWNEGGIAVSGEATLHTDLIYVQVSDVSFGILYRTCEGRKDYIGGPNHWYSWREVEENGVEGLAVVCERLVVQEPQEVK